MNGIFVFQIKEFCIFFSNLKAKIMSELLCIEAWPSKKIASVCWVVIGFVTALSLRWGYLKVPLIVGNLSEYGHLFISELKFWKLLNWREIKVKNLVGVQVHMTSSFLSSVKHSRSRTLCDSNYALQRDAKRKRNSLVTIWTLSLRDAGKNVHPRITCQHAPIS